MKQNKIITVVSSNPRGRTRMIQRTLVRLNFALTPGDADKLIMQDIYEVDLTTAYYVCADNFNFRKSPITTQRLYEMAARGICVIVGVRRLQREFEFICEAIYE